MNTQTYTVNIRTGVVNIARVDVSQGDAGRTLAFKLYDGLVPFTPPSGSTVTIVGRKPSGLGFSETCTVSGNTAAVNTTLAMTQESGKIPVELRIESDTRSIGTANFVLSVEPSPHPEGTTDGTHATVDNLQTQIGNLANLATTAKTNLVSAINEAAQSGGVVIDDTLTQTGAAADSKKTGDEIASLKADLEDLDDRVEALESGSGGSGLTNAVKTALLQLAQKVAYIDDDGQDYYDDLYNALYPPADLVSISAVYTQSGTVYEGSSINSLKSDLVVTALMSDQTTQTVTNYTLSGTLTAGTSTITVSYGGKTATFTVTVAALTYVQDGLVMWLDGEKNGTDGAHETTLTTWVDQTGNGWDWTNSGATVGEKSVIFADSAHLNRNKDDLPQNVATIEIAYKKATGGCVLTGFGRSYLGNINMPSTSDLIVFHTASGSGSDKNTAFDASANTAHTANSAGYLDGVQIESFGSSAADWQYTYPCIGLYRGSGGSATQYPFSGEIYCIRLYSRALTEQEILHNASIDMQRFGIGA